MVTIRDREALLILLAMPFIIITILGLALGDSFGGDPGLEKYDIGVIDKDKGEISKLLVDDTLRSDELAKLITVKKMSAARATRLIQRGELAAAVVIPKSFSAHVQNGEGGELEILGDPGQALRSSILEGITGSFARRLSAITIGVKAPLDILIESEAIAPGDVDQTANLLTKEAQIAASKPTITVGNEKTAAKIELSAIQYYAAGMGIMFLLFSAMFGAIALINERANMTLARLLSTPTKKSTILGGKLAGIFLIGFLQFLTLALATRLIFGVNWGGSLLGFTIMVVATVLAATGMSVFVAAVAKTVGAANAISQILIQGMSALGGSMIPLVVFPDALKNVSRFTINYWAMDGFTKLMQGANFSVTLFPALILLGFAAAFMTVGIWRFQYE